MKYTCKDGLFSARFSVSLQIVIELRTGYCRLNGYRYETGLQDPPNCRCGDPESVHRYKTGLQDPPNCRCGDPESVQTVNCVTIHERLRTRLFFSCGIKDFITGIQRQSIKTLKI